MFNFFRKKPTAQTRFVAPNKPSIAETMRRNVQNMHDENNDAIEELKVKISIMSDELRERMEVQSAYVAALKLFPVPFDEAQLIADMTIPFDESNYADFPAKQPEQEIDYSKSPYRFKNCTIDDGKTTVPLNSTSDGHIACFDPQCPRTGTDTACVAVYFQNGMMECGVMKSSKEKEFQLV